MCHYLTDILERESDTHQAASFFLSNCFIHSPIVTTSLKCAVYYIY